ncbi:hypothetical protein [Streptomyces sp. NPDC053541]|uniref:hypothetical protein n=1 Tax=Streptomyces sp. NPDC053541 TaxID=3365709 RepID=UPI0037D70938
MNITGITTITRRRRPPAFLLLGLAIALGAGVVAGLAAGGEGALVLLLGLREYVVVLGWLFLAALTGAVLLGLPSRSWLRVPLATGLLVIGAPILLIGGWVSGTFGDDDQELRTEPAPGRADRRLVVVDVTGGFLDPTRCVHVRQGIPPWERRWSVGCFNADAEENALAEAAWTAPDRIRMTTEGGAVHTVTLDAHGRPDRIVSVPEMR